MTTTLVQTSFLHRTTKESWIKIRKEGILWGVKKYAHLHPFTNFRRYTYLSPVDWGDSYGSVLLRVNYSPKGPPFDNYGFDQFCDQFCVWDPIPLDKVYRIGDKYEL